MVEAYSMLRRTETVRMRHAASLAVLVLLGACASHAPRQAVHHHYAPSRYYPPPGPANDPWGPYVHEASGRFGVPEVWIRSVMRQESGGQEDVISWAGAMGLMQLMPDTFDDLHDRYSLGDDPFDPHNNILAGTAYIREMYDRYGAPGFLAAYNAGPRRLDRYLNNGETLPAETVNYVASIAPRLGPETPMSGPLAVYGGQRTYASMRPATPAGCDPDAAYNPDGPCTPLRPVEVAYAPPSAPSPTPAWCDPDAAYDPTQPCRPAPVRTVAAPTPAPPPRQFVAESRPVQERMAQLATFKPGPPPGQWGIQVGAFANLSAAQNAAEGARTALPDLLQTTKVELPATTPLGTQVAFRARLMGLQQPAAVDACSRLTAHGTACIVVPPNGEQIVARGR